MKDQRMEFRCSDDDFNQLGVKKELNNAMRTAYFFNRNKAGVNVTHGI